MNEHTPGPITFVPVEANVCFAVVQDLIAALEVAKEHLEYLFYWDVGQHFCGHCKKPVPGLHTEDCPIFIIEQAIAKAKESPHAG